MKSIRCHDCLRLAALVFVVCLSLAVFIPGRAAVQRLDLVRIEVDPAQDLGELAQSGVLVYARLYGEDGRLVLLLGADDALQARLRDLGYRPVVLARDVAGIEYYQLYGLPADLQKADKRMALLAWEGRQAVADPSRTEMRMLDGLGVGYKPLNPQPLVYRPVPLLKSQSLPTAFVPDPLVQEMIGLVSPSALSTYVGDLSGEWAANIDGLPFALSTRYSFAEPFITKATSYVYGHFVQMGLPAAYHTYNLWGDQKRNVHAWQEGVTQPSREFLVTAHMDSTSQSPYSLAPGADDNASGTAGVLATANILKDYRFGCSLRYVLFTGEEQGLYGSAAFARDLVNTPGIQVEGVLNLDMIAYNSLNSDPSMELHVRTGNAEDLQIAGLFQQVVTNYGLDLLPAIIQPGNTFSDHSSFWNQSVPAILAIEDWKDHTPYYHQTSDQLESLNSAYFSEMTRAAVGTLAHMGCLLDEGVLIGTVKDATTSAPLAGVGVRAVLDASQEWTTTSQADGSFQLLVPPGSFDIEFYLPYYFMVESQDIPVQRARENSLKVGLSPCGWGISYTSLPILPSAGETVTFTAGAAGLPDYYYDWDFGDGGTGNGQVVSHAFADPGLYSVSLEIATCPLTIVQHSIPVQLPALFFPLAPVPVR